MKASEPVSEREREYFDLDRELRRVIPARRRYFSRYAGDIANLNFECVKLMSGVIVLVTLIFVAAAYSLLNTWTITPAHIILGAVMAVFHLAVVNCPRKKRLDYRFSTGVTAAFLLLMLSSVVAIDLLATDAAVFLPICYVVLGVTLVLPYALTLPIFGVTELVFILCVFRIKPYETACMDVFSTMFGLCASLAAGLIVTTVLTRESVNSRQYKMLSRVDPLTGVINKQTARSEVVDYLKTRQQNAQCALLVLDVDEFKRINDTYGHKKGDEILEKIGELLRGRARENDIVGRFGGDEFIMFLKDISGREAIEKICFDIRMGMRVSTGADCSIGAAWIRVGSYAYETLFRVADDALYFSKASGKGRETVREVVRVVKKNVLLIADDDFAARVLLRRSLEKKYDLIEADSGEKVLNLLSHYENRVSAVLLRLDMAGTDGLDTLKKIRERWTYDALPVIAVTESAEEEKRALRLGANDQLSRPYDMDIVGMRVENVLRGAHGEE